MKHDEERIKKVASLYVKTIAAAFFISLIGGYMLIDTFFKDSGFVMSVIIGYCFCTIVVKLSENIFKNYVRKNVYNGDINAFDADMKHVVSSHSETNSGSVVPPAENNPSPQKANIIQLTILNKPEKPIAKYMDADIYEWLDFETEAGTSEKFVYFGTVNLDRETIVPDGCVLIHPGILYRHHSLEK